MRPVIKFLFQTHQRVQQREQVYPSFRKQWATFDIPAYVIGVHIAICGHGGSTKEEYQLFAKPNVYVLVRVMVTGNDKCERN